ncbi:MAG: isoprenylcysteine carboxylmethyltransferase family protein [Magnetococcales bacterium]|nr:isoprenylcysteine carboxylmethyltransferase family protein [Magnetococcales bacterium]
MRIVHFLLGLFAYIFFNVVFIYFICFLVNFKVPKSIDAPMTDINLFQSVAIDLVLILIFAIHHSLTPRAFFKKWIQKYIPWHLERSVYVMISSALLSLIMWQWRPVTIEFWRIEGSSYSITIYFLFIIGSLSSLAASFHIDHYDLFGVRQVYCYLRNVSYPTPEYNEKGLYRLVRHPIMLGTLMALWLTPVMTAGHFLFSISMSFYIFVGTLLEERDLLSSFGHSYKDYQRRVPMIIPFIKIRRLINND